MPAFSKEKQREQKKTEWRMTKQQNKLLTEQRQITCCACKQLNLATWREGVHCSRGAKTVGKTTTDKCISDKAKMLWKAKRRRKRKQ